VTLDSFSHEIRPGSDLIGNTCKQFPTVPSKYESRMASSLFRISIVAGFPPADEYVVVDGRDASCMMLNIKLASASASCPYRQFYNKVVNPSEIG
jgi:hypothetical protein